MMFSPVGHQVTSIALGESAPGMWWSEDGWSHILGVSWHCLLWYINRHSLLSQCWNWNWSLWSSATTLVDWLPNTVEISWSGLFFSGSSPAPAPTSFLDSPLGHLAWRMPWALPTTICHWYCYWEGFPISTCRYWGQSPLECDRKT